MIRAAVALLSTVVFVFSVTFVVARLLRAEPRAVPQLVTAPAPTDARLTVRSIGRAAALPALRRSPAGAATALTAAAAAPPSPLRAKGAGS